MIILVCAMSTVQQYFTMQIIKKLNKRGLGWEMIVGIVITLLVLVLLIVFSDQLKEKMVELAEQFIKGIFGR